LLSFTYVYFFESGLFNGLEPIQIKIFLSSLGSARNVTRAPFLVAAAKVPAPIPASDKCIASISVVCKSIVAKSAFQVANAGGASLAANQASGWRRLAGENYLFIALIWTSLRREGEDR
jgi:hypothetical protein